MSNKEENKDIIILDKDAIKTLAPSALKNKLTKKEIESNGCSAKKYQFFNTNDVISDFNEMGWNVIQAKSQTPQKRNVGKIEDVTKHLLRFRHLNYSKSMGLNELYPEILITSAHDGTAAFRFDSGLYRKICANGLVVSDRVFEQLRVKHMNTDFAEIRAHMKTIVEHIPNVMKRIHQWQKIKLDEKAQLKFATEALVLRHSELYDKFDRSINMKELKEKFKPLELLTVQRDGDKPNDLWHVYNRVQENLIKGNYSNYDSKNQFGNKTARQARSIDFTVDRVNFRNTIGVNKELWKLTEHFAKNLS
jgi:hypothetical protein